MTLYAITHHNCPTCTCANHLSLKNKDGLLPCPLCGSNEFELLELSDRQATAIYCDKCPYGVEDNELTISDLKVFHNRRS